MIDTELMELAAQHSNTLAGSSALLHAAVQYSSSWADLASMMQTFAKLLDEAVIESNELFDKLTGLYEEPEEQKEAPEPAATGTSASEKTIQPQSITEEKFPSSIPKTDIKAQIVKLLKQGVSVAAIEERTGKSRSYIYKVKNEVM